MKKIIFGFLFLASISINAQELIKEPTFIGEAFIIKSDNSTIDLKKEQVQLKTRVAASVFLVGIGKLKTKIDVINCCSSSSVEPDGAIKLVVRAVDNETDPLSIIQVFKFKKTKKKRSAELESFGIFSGGSSNNLAYLKFKADKYGENSYMLIIENYERGEEYGVIVSNPNSLDQRQTIVSTFGID